MPWPLFTPRKDRNPLYRRLDGPQGRSGQVQKISSPLGFNPRTVQLIASHYTDWATWPTIWIKTVCIITGSQDSNWPEEEQRLSILLHFHSNPACWHSHRNINKVAHCNRSNDMITNAQNRLMSYDNGTELIWPFKALVINLSTAKLICMKRARAVIAAHAIKALRGTELYLHTILTLALNTVEWPAHALASLPPRKESLIPNEHRGWMGQWTGMNAPEKRRTSCLCWEFNCNSSVG